MKKILIAGGTGKLGNELVKQLLQQGDHLRVMSRNPEKAGSLIDAGIEVVRGDLIDKTSLIEACHGMEVVISAAHSLLGRGRYTSECVDDTGQRSLIDAARSEGIQHFIYTSGIGAAPDHALDFSRTKWQVEAYLKQSGLTYNIIRPTFFMETHIQELMGKSMMDKGKVTIFGKGVNQINFVSVKDVALLIKLCLDNPQYRDQTFEIGGLDNVSRLEIVEMYAQKTGKPIKINHIPNGVLRFMSKVIKPFHPGISRIMFFSDLIDRQDQSFDVRPLLEVFPMKITRVSDFYTSSSALSHNN